MFKNIFDEVRVVLVDRSEIEPRVDRVSFMKIENKHDKYKLLKFTFCMKLSTDKHLYLIVFFCDLNTISYQFFLIILNLIFEISRSAGAQSMTVKPTWLWVRSPLEMKYLL